MNINFRSQRLLQGYDFLQSQSDVKPVKVLVHEFIQSVVFNPFPQDCELQVERLVLAGNMYESIGFKRKAAFYRRFAALKSVTVVSNWQECYDSLLGSLDGFGLTLDPVDYEKALADKCSSVWPGLHTQLIEELITCCKKIQNVQAGTLAIRHMSFMLHTLDFYLSTSKKRDLAKELEEASTIFGEDSPVPLKLSSGYVIPTVNLTKYPLCLKLEPLALPMSLRPVRLLQLRRKSMLTPIAEDKPDNPFIFTPIANHSSLTPLETRRTASNSIITDIVWVQDEPCFTVIVLKNTMPFELRVTSIKLLTDGVPLETTSSSLKLDAEPNSQATIQLIGIPRQMPRTADDSKQSVNKLEIFGYSTHLLGVKSNCRLDMIPKTKFPSQYIVEVSPPLPRIEFQFPESENVLVDPIPADQVDKDLVVMEFKATVDLDDRINTRLTVLNSSSVDVDYLYIQEKPQQPSLKHGIIVWENDKLEKLNSSPLKSGQKFDLPITIDASKDIFKTSKSLSTSLTFEYSGGLALAEMFGRKCSIKFTIMIAEEVELEHEAAKLNLDDVERSEASS